MLGVLIFTPADNMAFNLEEILVAVASNQIYAPEIETVPRLDLDSCFFCLILSRILCK